MVNTGIVLVSIDIGAVSKREVQALDTASESNVRRIQTIGWGLSSNSRRRKLIGPWHSPQRLLHVSAITDGGTEWIAEDLAICDRRAIERAITE